MVDPQSSSSSPHSPNSSSSCHNSGLNNCSNDGKKKKTHGGWFELSPLKINLVAGAGSGVVNSILCSPLDVAKIRQQLQGAYMSSNSQRYNGVFSTLRIIHQEEGYKGLFRGIRPSLMTLPLFWAIYFPAYEAAKEKFATWGFTGPLAHCSSAMVGGFMSDVATNPLWVVRTRMVGDIYHSHPDASLPQTQSVYRQMKHIVKKEGFMALYKGLSASMLGLTHVGLQFPIYEKFKELARDVQRHGFDVFKFWKEDTTAFKGNESSKSVSSSSSSSSVVKGDEDLGEAGRILGLIIASASSKAIASSITYPHEVLRSRMQDSRVPMGLLATGKQIIAMEGMAGFFRGLTVNLARVLPSCVTVFLSYELISNHMKSIMDKKPATQYVIAEEQLCRDDGEEVYPSDSRQISTVNCSFSFHYHT